MMMIKKILVSAKYKYAIQAVLIFTFGINYLSKPAEVFKTVYKAPSHIVFIENSFDEALKQGKLQNKYIFVDAYATWCGPCKMLKVVTFSNSKAAEFFNANFINVSIDMEKGQGPALAAQWQLQAYPTLIVFNPQGKPVLGTVGFLKADDLIRFGKQALSK